jgi:uncharacterized protein (TIGR00297 family)
VDDLTRWVVGVVAATLVGFLAYRAKALSASGALAAAMAGGVAVAAGWSWGLLLVAYFLSTSALSRFHALERTEHVGGVIDKDGPRDGHQVLANGGAFSLAAIGWIASPDPLWQCLAVAALAASAADTWATEIGTLARAAPRSIVSWELLPAGTSGGVTLQGSLAALAGAAFLALVAWLLRWPASAIAAAIIGGAAGCLLDSWIGATIQSRRHCDACGKATEMRVHFCGNETRLLGGWRWLDNDGVNALSTFGGALVGAAGARYF